MPGFMPDIHAFLVTKQGVDGRDKPGHDKAMACEMRGTDPNQCTPWPDTVMM
jgi:hypothetical protein